MKRRALVTLAALLLALVPTATGCDLGPEEGEVTEVEQELESTELTVWCGGEEIDVDIKKTDEWTRGDIYGCQVRDGDRLSDPNR